MDVLEREDACRAAVQLTRQRRHHLVGLGARLHHLCQLAAGLLRDREQRAERTRGEQRVAAAPQDPQRADRFEEAPQQRGLADSGLAPHEHDPALRRLAHSFELRVESSELASALEQVARRLRGHGWPRSGIQRLVSYLVRSTPSGNVRVSTRFRFTQLSRAVKNGVPPPTRTGWVTIAYSSISPARMAAPARVAPAMSMRPPSSVLSRVISVTASPVTRRAFQSTARVVEENTTFGMSRHRRADSVRRGVAPGRWSAVGQWELIVSHSLRPYSARPVAPTRSDHHWNSSSLGTLQPRSSPGAAM